MKQKTKIWIGLLLLFAACSPSSYITSSWKAAGVQPRKYNKILVLGLINENDRTIREKMEEHVVGDLKELGYNAVCSCDEYSPRTFENMGEKEAIGKLNHSGVDAVLTIVLLDKTKEKYYTPYRAYSTDVMYRRDHFWGYYTDVYDRVYSPGYHVIENTKYFWESNFYDLPTNEILYSSQSRSFDPTSSASLGHEYGQMIVKDMVKDNVLASQKPVMLKPM